MAQYSIKKVHKKPANITTSWENKKLLKICFSPKYGETNEN